MKRKRIITILIIILITVVLGIFFISKNAKKNIKNKTENKSDAANLAEDISNIDYNSEIKYKIKDKNSPDKEIYIREDEIKTIESITKESIDKDELIEREIFVLEAKKRKLELDKQTIERITGLSNSDEFLGSITDESEKKKVQNAIYKYLENIQYESKLKNTIIDEINLYKLSIEDAELNRLLGEYKEIKESMQLNDPDNKLPKASAKYYEIEKLYYSKIKEGYEVEEY